MNSVFCSKSKYFISESAASHVCHRKTVLKVMGAMRHCDKISATFDRTAFCSPPL